MPQKLLSLTVIFILLGFQIYAQVIDLDEEQEIIAPDRFEKSTMFYLTPLGAFGYQLGHANMRGRLNSSLDLDISRWYDLSAFGIGWRRKAMFYNFHMALPIFPNSSSTFSGNTKTEADMSIGYGEFTVGRAIVSNDRHFIILRAGLGLMFSELQIRQFSSDSFDMNNFRTAQGTAWPAFEHISGTFDLAIEYTPRPLRRLTVMESIQLGYKGSIGTSNWNSKDAAITNIIGDSISMIYFRTSVVISRQR